MCGEVFGEGLAPSLMAHRKTCSMACAGERSRKPKKCNQCAQVIPKGSQTTCSSECAKAAWAKRRQDTKVCAVCDIVFDRKPGCSGRHWAAQRFCSRQCVLAKAGPLVEAKNCNNCGSLFTKRSGEKNSVFRKRRGCSTPCSRKLSTDGNRVGDVDRPCEACGAIMTVRPHSKRKVCPGCRHTTKQKLVDVFGVMLTHNDIAALTGLTRSAIGTRIRKGRDPLTGEHLTTTVKKGQG